MRRIFRLTIILIAIAACTVLVGCNDNTPADNTPADVPDWGAQDAQGVVYNYLNSNLTGLNKNKLGTATGFASYKGAHQWSVCYGLDGLGCWNVSEKTSAVVPGDQTAKLVAGGRTYTPPTDSTDGSSDNNPISTDRTPPTISNLAVSGITSNGATVTWTTDEPATSQVKYGLTYELGSTTTLDSTLATNHSVTLSGLSSGDYYYVKPCSMDASGNEGYYGNSTFYTSMQQNLTMGKTAQNSEQKVTVKSASRVSSYQWGSGYTEHAASGKVYIIVDVVVENIGSKSFYTSSYDLSISDSAGFKYDQGFYFGDDDFRFVELFPGQKTQGKVLFEVPTTATGLKIAYDFGVLEPCVATWVL